MNKFKLGDVVVFKPGDAVVCIKAGATRLKLNREYKVVEIKRELGISYIRVEPSDDIIPRNWFFAHRFKPTHGPTVEYEDI